MKNVRLFAVAAAMGMFASTVAAAETTTHSTYVGTWGEMTEIVKVDIGNKVVAPAASIKVVKETRTTDLSEVKTANGLGFQLYPTCYVGYTNEEADDDNMDGWVDDEMLFADAYTKEWKYYYTSEGDTAKANALSYDSQWITNDAKFFPSVKTALHYIGATDGSSVLGGYFLAPGAAEKEIYASDLANKHFADEEAVVNWLIEEGKVNWNYDEEGDIVSATINKFTATDKDGHNVADYELRIIPNGTRKVEDKLIAAITAIYEKGLNNFLPSEWAKLDVTTKYVATYYNDGRTPTALTHKYQDSNDNWQPMSTSTYYVVTENKRKGTFTIEPLSATSSDLYNGQLLDASGKAIALDPNNAAYTFVMVNDDSDDDYTIGNTTYTTYSRFSTVKATKNTKYAKKSAMYWNEELAGFVEAADGAVEYDFDFTNNAYLGTKLDGTEAPNGFWWDHIYNAVYNPNVDATTQLASILDVAKNSMGLLHIETVENDSDKIVVAHPALAGANAQLSVKDETFTYTIYHYTNSGSGVAKTVEKTIVVDAVRLEDGWYPAVKNEEELEQFIGYVAHLDVIEGYHEDKDPTVPGKEKVGTFGNWFVDAYEDSYRNPVSGLTNEKVRTLADGTQEAIYAPANSLQHYAGTFCTYAVEGGEEVNATITTDAASIDTTTAGIKTLTYTAKVGEEVVGTKEIKVVVAPNYERVYKNGKVVKLTAKWLNGNTYAVYNYDWAAKTFTATFYEEDGVTVASTTNGTL